MARSFNNSSSLIAIGAAPVLGSPLTMSCWFNFASSTLYCPLMCIAANNEGSNDRFVMYADGTRGDVISIITQQNSLLGPATSGASYTSGTWHHAGAIFTSVPNMTSYLDGIAGSAVSSNVPASMVVTRIGCEYFSGSNQFGNGLSTVLIAEAALWNVALTASEITALAAGVRPSRVRPGALKGYWPLFGLGSYEPDLSGKGNNGTLIGTSYANHAPVTTFSKRGASNYYPASAGPTFKPAWASRSSQSSSGSPT
jgi:hypothetical protein